MQANISTLFTELPFDQRPAAAAAAGFDAVECWWPFATARPDTSTVDRFVTAVSDAGVRLGGLNFYAGDMSAGERGIVSHPDRRADFDDAVEMAVDIGARLGVSVFNALYGNRLPDVSAQEHDACAVEALAAAAGRADLIGATVLVEAVSAVPTYPLKRADDVVAIIDRAREQLRAGHLALLADFYHLIVNGDDPVEVIARHADRIGHVQIADVPGRHEPGTGNAPLVELLTALVGGGYRGQIGLEYLPQGDTVAGLAWLSQLDVTANRVGVAR